MSARTKISTGEFHASKVLVLNEATSEEAAGLFQAPANAPGTPEAVALDHLMDDDVPSVA